MEPRHERIAKIALAAGARYGLALAWRVCRLRARDREQGFVKVAGGIHPGERHVKSSSRSARWGSWAQRRVSSV